MLITQIIGHPITSYLLVERVVSEKGSIQLLKTKNGRWKIRWRHDDKVESINFNDGRVARRNFNKIIRLSESPSSDSEIQGR